LERAMRRAPGLMSGCVMHGSLLWSNGLPLPPLDPFSRGAPRAERPQMQGPGSSLTGGST
jgi:hypothetical protein